MIIYPAIDIKNAKCVRLYQGDYARETVYSADPLAIAKKFYNEGATWIHIVDLDGADNPACNQLSLISDIIHNIDIKVQIGGGIRSQQQVEYLLNIGAERVIIGSMTVKNPGEVAKWLYDFGADHIVLALDVIYNSNNQALITSNAWKNVSEYSLFDLISYYQASGLKHVLCTSIGLDGTLKGPDYQLYNQVIEQFPHLCLQASGGIHSIGDITLLQKQGLHGAIVGRALYENKITLPEVLNHAN